MLKNAYSIQMSYQITDEEKHQAEKTILYFKYANKLLDTASAHLNIMKTPFKENPEISPEEIMKVRATLRKFRDKAVDNFNSFKEAAFRGVISVQQFSSDTQTIKLVKSFINSVDDLQVKVNEFVDAFGDLKSKDFVKNIVDIIEKIQKQCEDIEEIIEERIREHIQNNILNTNWIDDIGKELEINLNKKTPIMIDLYNKRQEKLNQISNKI